AARFCCGDACLRRNKEGDWLEERGRPAPVAASPGLCSCLLSRATISAFSFSVSKV
ncbi:hypothetical protein TGPRC2_306410C, partial [Toxoplasma gondii TgCatPRC2]